MGYLTTFTIYNDGLDTLFEDCDEFCQKLRYAAIGGESNTIAHGSLRTGLHAHLVKVQRPRHADDHTTYVHMGNTVCEMHPYAKETKELMTKSPAFFEQMLKHLERNVRELKAVYQEHKAEQQK